MKDKKLYTEEDLRQAFKAGWLSGKNDDNYFDKPLDEDEYIQSLNPIEKEEIIYIPYFWIKNNIGWSKFCDITGGDKNGLELFGEPTWDLEVTISEAKKIGYIK